jgi:hypothetical protein
MNIIAEAYIVGIICMIIGSIVFVMVAKLSPLHLSTHTKNEINKHKKLWLIQGIISLFLTGFLGHLFFEVTGINIQLYKLTGFWLW